VERFAALLRGRTFRSLAERNFRLFLGGHGVSVIGTWVQRVAQDWLVYSLTGSGVALGVSLALQFGPMLLFGLWGGVLVDRVNRFRLIVVTQAVSGVLAAALGVLTLTGVVELWMVYALTCALGAVTVLDNPARHAFLAEIVGDVDYVNAQSLNSAVQNAGRLVGPAIAGLVIAGFGVGLTFVLNAVSFAGVLAGLAAMDRTRLRPVPPIGRAPGQVREGVRYVAARPELLLVLLMVLVVALFGQNFRIVLPLLASEEFRAGPDGYAYLMTAMGAGAVLGALVTASRRTVGARSVLLSCTGFGLVNLTAAVVPSIGLAYAAMVLVGFANISFNSLARTVLQTRSDRAMHGRVMALHSLLFFGTIPVGGPFTGWLCEAFGARSGLAVAGVSALLVALVLHPVVRRLRSCPGPTRSEPDPAA